MCVCVCVCVRVFGGGGDLKVGARPRLFVSGQQVSAGEKGVSAVLDEHLGGGGLCKSRLVEEERPRATSGTIMEVHWRISCLENITIRQTA